MFFSAVLTTGFRRRAWAEGDPHDECGHRDDGYDSDNHFRTCVDGYDSGPTMLCKDMFPKIAILKIRWATVNTVMWRCDELIKVHRSPLRVVLKESPRPSTKVIEASSWKDDHLAKIIFKEAPGVIVNERHTSPTWNTSFASNVLDGIPADTHQATAYVSSCAQGCDDIEKELCASKLDCKL